jgi:hypothetical protein
MMNRLVKRSPPPGFRLPNPIMEQGELFVTKHILTDDDKRELEMQRAHALKAIDDLLAQLPFLRVMVQEGPYDGFEREAAPIIKSVERKARATWVRVQLMFSTIAGSKL